MSLMKVQQKINQTSKEKIFCSAKELAQLFNLSQMRIIQLRQEGMPGMNGEYPLKECISWYVRKLQEKLDENQNQTIVSEKVKLIKAKALKAEIEVKKLEGSILDQEDVKQDMMRILSGIKENFLSFPGKFAYELEDKKAIYIKNFLMKKILEELNNIAERLENENNNKEN